MPQGLDAGARTLLREFGIAEDALLGSGGEAWVFALDAERVLRVPRPGTSRSESALRSALLRELEPVATAFPSSCREFSKRKALAAALPHCETRSLVHLDAFAGNMLARDGRITAVLDFGPLAVTGDRRLDAWTAAAYLAPEITPGATAEDLQIAQQWFAEHRLDRDFDAAHRWLAAFWSGAVDAPRLQAWSRRVLGIPSTP